MTEESQPTNALTATQQPLFAELVATQLKAKGVKLSCPTCRVVGMAAFDITGLPAIRPTVQQGLYMQEASVVCKKCGYTMLFNLNILGISIQQEQRRVLTASEVAQQQNRQPLIVQP